MQIGSYTLPSKLLLAPMAGITDPPFRSLCRRFGAGLATSEMLTSDITLWDSKKSLYRLPQPNESEPRSVQIAGTDPKLMAEATQLSITKGAQIIDINFGCPAKKVCNKAAGSALMQDPETARAIIRAVTRTAATLNVPVTLKMRTGWSRKHKNALEIAKIAEDNQISALSIHGRTRQDGYSGYAEYETIRRVKQAVSIPVIANGDLRDSRDLNFVLSYTGVDALMLGRVTQGQPWIFHRYNTLLETGTLPEDLSFFQKAQVILEHIKQIHHLFGTTIGVKLARKHIGWYLDRLAFPANKKKTLFGATTSESQVQLLAEVLVNPPNKAPNTGR